MIQPAASRRLIVLVTLLAATVAIRVARAADPEPLAIGAAAPDFSLPGVDDKTHALAEYKDAKVLALVFLCNHCPTAQAYEERIKTLVHDYKDRGVQFVAVSPNDPLAVRLDELGYAVLGDSFDEMKLRAEDHKFNFPYLYDGETQTMVRAYGAVTTPHVFLFDAQRRLRYRGRIDDNEDSTKATTHETRDAIDALLAGKPVAVETTRTIGCSIKWAEKRKSAAESLAKWDQETATLESIDEQAVRDLVANKTDNLRLINVWSTTCGPCMTEFPEVVKMHRMYRKREIEVVTITTDPPERRDAALKFLNEMHAATTNYIFAGENPYKLADALGADWEGALPFTMLVKPGGEVVYKRMGELEPVKVRQAIIDVLTFHKVEVPAAKAPQPAAPAR
jgi:peroxiredoxin